ncbi:MAG: hypothetical protein U0175_25675 [Caldilineaceae bacterium]
MRDCRVNHLHVKTSAPDAVRQAALLVEDGLRTASFPDEGGRLVIVRSLALGRIGHAASALTVSMQIEQALQRLPRHLVHATAAEAGTAAAVYFRHEAEAFTIFALQLAKGIAPTDWFWQRLIPAYRPQLGNDEGVRLLLRTMLAHRESKVLLTHLVKQMVEAGKISILLDPLQPQDGTHLLQHFGWQSPTFVEQNVSPPRHHKSTLATILQQWIGKWGATDDRTLWLANLLTAIEEPLRLEDTQLSQRSMAWIDQVVAAPPENTIGKRVDAEFIEDSHQPTRQQSEVDAPRQRAKRRATAADQGLTDTFLQRKSNSTIPAGIQQSEQVVEPTNAEVVEDTLWEQDLERTVAGGLFFLLNLLNRLYFGDWLLKHPQWLEAGLSHHLLARLCQQLSIEASDPIWQVIALEKEDKIPGDLQLSCDAWLDQLANWCSEFVELDLATVVLRPARLHATPTHIDLYFDLNQVDLRLRRIGLDFDPGWVAWFGRVVMFHYG